MKYGNLYMTLAALGLAAPAGARKLEVGPGQAYAQPSAAAGAAKDGDTVEIAPGDYHDIAVTWQANRLTLRGASAYAHLVAPATISNGKAIWVTHGDGITVENVEFSDAAVPDQNGAGIRAEGKDLVVRHCLFHDDEDGILGGSGHVTIEYSEFRDCGRGDGYTHNVYISGASGLTFRYNLSRRSKVGHLLKSRADTNYILYNRLLDEDGTGSYEIDLPDGGMAWLVGNAVQQGPNSENGGIIMFGEESTNNPGTSFYAAYNTVVNDRGSGTFFTLPAGGKGKLVGNLCVGSGTLLRGAADTAGNLVTADGGLADRSRYDYRLAAASPALNRGPDPGSAAGFSLVPVQELPSDLVPIPRPQAGALDLGAYEYQPGAALLPSRPRPSPAGPAERDGLGRALPAPSARAAFPAPGDR